MSGFDPKTHLYTWSQMQSVFKRLGIALFLLGFVAGAIVSLLWGEPL